MAVGLASNGVLQLWKQKSSWGGLSGFVEEPGLVHTTLQHQEKTPLHFNSAAVSISVIQGGVIRGLFIHQRCLPGGR